MVGSTISWKPPLSSYNFRKVLWNNYASLGGQFDINTKISIAFELRLTSKRKNTNEQKMWLSLRRMCNNENSNMDSMRIIKKGML
jgi:hypothetical protein